MEGAKYVGQRVVADQHAFDRASEQVLAMAYQLLYTSGPSDSCQNNSEQRVFLLGHMSTTKLQEAVQ